MGGNPGKARLPRAFARGERLIRRLREPKAAAAYLNGAVMTQDRAAFLRGMRDVLQARGGISQAAARSKLNRQAVYRMLSEDGNPELHSLQRLLGAAGLGLRVISVTAEGDRGGTH
ncbi:MAG: DNA-binding protein [Burkholderiales bacterium]